MATSSARKQLVIIGAGAIGRGFLPWVFSPDDYDMVFVDTSPKLLEELQRAGQYTTYRIKDGALEARTVRVHAAYSPKTFPAAQHAHAAAAFVCVGPRNVAAVAPLLASMRGPVILCENDPATVAVVKAGTGLSEVFFAVPDVITSSTAAPALRAAEPLSVVTEDGVLFVDSGAATPRGLQVALDSKQLDQQWTAKLYLHNTPHCVAAYLGALLGVEYMHEAMRDAELAAIVEGSMREMLTSLKLKWDIDHKFLDWYAQKELDRFRSEQLFDPIARVAREPLRKLELEGRLIGSAQICLSLGFIPENILVGIASALLFEDENDADRHLGFMRRALPPSALLTHVLGLRKGEALELVLRDELHGILDKLEGMMQRRRR